MTRLIVKAMKRREIFLHPQVKAILADYITSLKECEPDWYLFHALFPQRKPYEQCDKVLLNCSDTAE